MGRQKPIDTSFSFGRMSGESGRMSPSDVIPTANISPDWRTVAAERPVSTAAKKQQAEEEEQREEMTKKQSDESPQPQQKTSAHSKHSRSPTERRRSTSLWEQISKGVGERRH